MCLFFNWFKCTATASGGGIVADVSQSVSVNGLGVIKYSFLGIFLWVIPVVMVLGFFIPTLSKYKKTIYTVGPAIGVLATLILGFVIKGFVASSIKVEGVDEKVTFGIGVWLTIVVYVIIIVLSIIMDFGVSKEELQTKGLKGVFGSVTSDITDSVSTLSEDMKNGSLVEGIKNDSANLGKGTACPQCANVIPFGKKFCSKCGYKLTEEEVQKNSNTPSNETTASNTVKSAEGIVNGLMGKAKSTVGSKAIGNVCECGYVNDYDKKYCGNCGMKLPVMEICSDCGAKILEGKKFCVECGAPSDKKKICEKCGSIIYHGRLYCTECGTKVNYQRNCPSCGSPIIEGKKFCPDCGKSYYS